MSSLEANNNDRRRKKQCTEEWREGIQTRSRHKGAPPTLLYRPENFWTTKSPPWLAISSPSAPAAACTVAAPPSLRLNLPLQSQPVSQSSGFQNHAQNRQQRWRVQALSNRHHEWRFPCHVGDAQQTHHWQWRFAKSPMHFT